MNLAVRAQRQAKDLPEDQAKALGKLLKRTQSSAAVQIEPGEWHTLRVRIKSDVMKADLNGKLVAELQSPGFDHPTKTQFGMTVNGTTIDFDNLKVREVKRDAAQ